MLHGSLPKIRNDLLKPPARGGQATNLKIAHVVDEAKSTATNPDSWREENHEAFVYWNVYAEEYGNPLDCYRQF